MGRHALLIGVDAFDDPRLNRLNAPLKDVEKLAELLRDPTRGRFDTVKTVSSGDFQETRNAILDVLLDDRVPEDLILLYYSGHGILAKDGELYFATKAIKMDLPLRNGISAADVRGWLNQSRAGKRIVLLDCCHSGAFPGPRKDAAEPPVLKTETLASSAEGQYVLTASDRLQFAYDATASSATDAQAPRYSKFTSWLVHAIETGSAAPSEEKITAGALRDYVVRRAREDGSGMRPQEFVTGEARDLLLARNPLAVATVIPQHIVDGLGSDRWQDRAVAVAELASYLAAPNARRAAAARLELEQRLDNEWDLRVRRQIDRALDVRSAQTPGVPALAVEPASGKSEETLRSSPPPEPTPSPTVQWPPEPPVPPQRVGRRWLVGALAGAGASAIGGVAYLTSDNSSAPPNPLPTPTPVPASPVADWAARRGQDATGRFADIVVNGITQRLRWIPPGRFRMGSPAGELGRFDDEGPLHAVTLARGFWLFDTPCMQALWQAVMGSNPSKFQGADRPVEQVSFSDVGGFLERINALVPGLQLELPSEARWEYAARAGTTAATYNGDLAEDEATQSRMLDPIAWWIGNSGGQTHPVGQKLANPWGLKDMLGNVWEWCADSWHDSYSGAPTDGSAWIGAGAAHRVIRGGSWRNEARYVRSASRRRRLVGPQWLPWLSLRPSSGGVSGSGGREEQARRAERGAATTGPQRRRVSARICRVKIVGWASAHWR
jgi:formylglycine-generating enzyme required for sulfatase activity